MTGMLGAVLISVALKSALILAATALAALALRRTSAATRHLVWAFGLAGVLALPLGTLLLPPWSVSLDVPAVVLARGRVTHPAAVTTTTARRPGAASTAPQERRVPTGLQSVRRVDTAGSILPPGPAPALAVTPQQGLIAVWVFGAVLLVGRIMLGRRAVARVVARSETVESERWQELLESLSADMGIGRVPLLLASRETAVPVTCGMRRHVIILPAEASSWSLDRVRVVLLHELAHIRRRDCLIHAMAQVVRALHWVNPLVWFAVARLTVERERACDDLVLAGGTRGSSYAEHLLDIARTVRLGRPLTNALAMARPSELEGRLLAILDAARDRSPATASRLVAGTAASALVVAIVAMLQIRPADAAVVPETIGEYPRQSAGVPAAAPTPAPAPEPMPQPPRLAPAQAPRPPAGGPAPSGPELPVVAPGPAPETRREKRTEVPDNVVKALAAALNDENAEVRQAALHALVRLESPVAFEPLMGALRGQNVEMRRIAAFSLGQLGDERAVAVLTSALKDEDAEVRHNAAFALGQLGTEQAVPALIAALQDPAADVRKVAAFALGQLGDPRALDPLAAALKDGDPGVRQSAAFALSQVIDDGPVKMKLKTKTPNEP